MSAFLIEFHITKIPLSFVYLKCIYVLMHYQQTHLFFFIHGMILVISGTATAYVTFRRQVYPLHALLLHSYFIDTIWVLEIVLKFFHFWLWTLAFLTNIHFTFLVYWYAALAKKFCWSNTEMVTAFEVSDPWSLHTILTYQRDENIPSQLFHWRSHKRQHTHGLFITALSFLVL